ncbi:hypothetical protein [Serpens gallinarum]|jgi:hypothetical protein|uniref:Uncharacterized protein n=1 Tax=Serpens gallinarum TaxID=2763075 RepID=A0ABR8TIL5_9PSED|nr:hypothetical protein [Serpens gallinarum]MBD7975623.1 hypothetical protein [Serpens gallinarum]
MSTTQPRSPARLLLLALLLAISAALVIDTHTNLQDGPVNALRTQEPVEGDVGSVDAFCGFAPCGMPLECN